MGDLVRSVVVEFHGGGYVWRRVSEHQYVAYDTQGRRVRQEGSSMMKYYYRNFPLNMAITGYLEDDA